MAEPARRILVELINRFGGSFATGLEKLENVSFKNVDENMDFSLLIGQMTGAIGGMARELSLNLKPKYYEDLTNTFGKRSEIKMDNEDGPTQMQTMDAGFRNVFFGTRLLLEAKWLAWCLEVQYKDFFTLVGTEGQSVIARKALAAIRSQSSSQKGSTGTSSESPVAPTTQAR